MLDRAKWMTADRVVHGPVPVDADAAVSRAVAFDVDRDVNVGRVVDRAVAEPIERTVNGEVGRAG